MRATPKHALVQDTAYETLLRSRRQILHRQIADVLREVKASLAAEPGTRRLSLTLGRA
jgi:hypothetical protein